MEVECVCVLMRADWGAKVLVGCVDDHHGVKYFLTRTPQKENSFHLDNATSCTQILNIKGCGIMAKQFHVKEKGYIPTRMVGQTLQ